MLSDNTIRQIKDVISQADRILSGNNANAEIGDFSRFSGEMKTYLLAHFSDSAVIDLVHQIPAIKPNKSAGKNLLLGLLFLPAIYFGAEMDCSSSHEGLLFKVREAKEKYARLMQVLEMQ